MFTLLDFMIGGTRRPLELVCKIDNTQAIAALHKGYSKTLKFLARKQKCAIGAVRELIESQAIVCEYHPTASHRGDGFTKALVPAKFLIACDMMGMQIQ